MHTTTWIHLENAVLGPYFSRSEVDAALRERKLSAGRGYYLQNETGTRSWGVYDFDCTACGHEFEVLAAPHELHDAACPECGAPEPARRLATPHVGNPGILADGSKRSDADELRFRRLKIERQSLGLPWQKRGEHTKEMANLATAASKSEGKAP